MEALIRINDNGSSAPASGFINRALAYYKGSLVKISITKIPESGGRDARNAYYHGVLCDRFAKHMTAQGEHFNKGKADKFFKKEFLGSVEASTRALTDMEFEQYTIAVEVYCIEAGVQLDLL